MQIEKSKVLDMLKAKGDDAKTSQAQSELPEQVDTDKDAGLLAKLNINRQDLLRGGTNKFGL